MGITGYAKNMPDGSVQVLACGTPDALKRLTAWLEEGPPLAQVDDIGWIESSSSCPDAFQIL
jgi:acylphosphatase